MSKCQRKSEQDTLDEIDIREIAHELRRDVRTVRRVVRGETVRGMAGAEIQRAGQEMLAQKMANHR